MVGYKLMDIDREGRLLYEYAIEDSFDSNGAPMFGKGEGSRGIASLDPVSGEAQIIRRAPNGFGWHESHLLTGLEREFKEKGDWPEMGYYAWY